MKKLILLVLLAGVSVQARFIRPDLVDVPIGRLIGNIATALDKKPDDVSLRHHLARAHAMAYAKNLGPGDAIKQWKGKDANAIWFGFTPPHVPFANAKPDGERSPGAKAHLNEAIREYVLLLKAKPDQSMRLGYAWCLKEAGKSEEAKAEFRKVIDAAWEQEGKKTRGGMRAFVTAESITYLLPLLDATADAKEIADLSAKQKKLQSLPRPITPIAVLLKDGLGAEDLVDRNASVAFDLDGSGFSERRWQWLRAENAAWLVHDPRGTGSIRSGLQLFGSRSFNLFFEQGYEALALLDDDGNGALRGPELRGLALWQDTNSNGRSEPGEVRPLSAHGIVALSCESEAGQAGPFSPRGVQYRDGSTRPSYDLVLEAR